MEGGLFRDPFSHQLIDADYWAAWQNPPKIKDEKEKVSICKFLTYGFIRRFASTS